MLNAVGVSASACRAGVPASAGFTRSYVSTPKSKRATSQRGTPTLLLVLILAQSCPSGLSAADVPGLKTIQPAAVPAEAGLTDESNCLGDNAGPPEGGTPALPRVPSGFTITRVTTPEMVQHPTMGCFDDRGRLYVCESAGTNAKAADLLKEPQDKIVRLEDTDGDGTFDRSVTFADKLVFPQGVLWHEGVVYTCSSPYLWKLEDADGDGVCDKRTVLVKSFGFSGNAADIHGPFLGPEGRLWWCDGRHGHEIRTNDQGLRGARTMPRIFRRNRSPAPQS